MTCLVRYIFDKQGCHGLVATKSQPRRCPLLKLFCTFGVRDLLITVFTCYSSLPRVWLNDCFDGQANTTDELPERLVSAVRVSHIELKSAIVPKLDTDPS